MKCNTCNKELNPYTPKLFCNIKCENNYSKAPNEIKDLFWWLFK